MHKLGGILAKKRKMPPRYHTYWRALKKGSNMVTSKTPVVLNNFRELFTSSENGIKALQIVFWATICFVFTLYGGDNGYRFA